MIEVIDLIANPQLAARDQIIAVPTLIPAILDADEEDHRGPLQHREGAGGPRSAERDLMDDEELPDDATAEFERALEALGTEPFVLRLYIAGNSARSQAAIENVKKICDEYLKDRCELDIVDIYQDRTDDPRGPRHRRADPDPEAAAAAPAGHRRHVREGEGARRARPDPQEPMTVAEESPVTPDVETLETGERGPALPEPGARADARRDPLGRGGRDRRLEGRDEPGVRARGRGPPVPRPRREHPGGRPHPDGGRGWSCTPTPRSPRCGVCRSPPILGTSLARPSRAPRPGAVRRPARGLPRTARAGAR